MDNLNWIPLADYSAKYKVSISTLRRRIKNEQIEYAFDNGKYFLPDLNIRNISKANKSFSQAAPPKASPKLSHQDEGLQLGQHFFGKDFLESLEESFEEPNGTEAHDAFVSSFSFPTQQETLKSAAHNMSPMPAIDDEEPRRSETSESMKEVLDHMTKELKKAYSAILQEKEEQLFLLKEQVVDLKTLVNILESENKRLLEQQEEMTILPHVIREKVQF
ncbi:MAG: hypothetical protein M9899_01110 [Bdellovibrionaceae bacterium]|nr:hypothetical protein [Pseudobdellovibrionaceae bacterium]